MTDIKRLGLGCMRMNRKNKEQSIRTIHAALDAGITLFNTGEFYQAGESELVVGEALKNIPRDKYFLSVKFGVLPHMDNKQYGLYGLDMNPFNIKAHITYSMTRLGLDYIDLYQPARLDLAIPVEEVIGALSDLIKEGYIGHIGLTQVDEETLRRANAVHPIHTVEFLYSLADRGYEQGMFKTAQELGVNVLTFGVLAHGLIDERILSGDVVSTIPIGIFAPENLEENRKLVQALKDIADKKGITVSNLALAWVLTKLPQAQSLIGTTSSKHLKESIEALSVELSDEDMREIETAFLAEKVKGKGMGDFVCRNGKIVEG